MWTKRERQPGRGYLARGALVIALGLVGVGASLAHVEGQRARPGIRIAVTQLAASGGLSGSAFLPVPASATQLSVAACGDARVGARAQLPRGPMRSAVLDLRGVRPGATLPVGDACPGATLTIGLEDESALRPVRGEVRITAVSADAVDGEYSATGERNGDPIAIRGTFHLPLTAP